MNTAALSNLLFAQVSKWERLGDGLHRDRGSIELADVLPWLIVLAILFVVIAVVIRLRKRNDMTEHCNDPDKLFRELSQAHDLDRGSKKLLIQLAERTNLAQPAEVFLRPGIFQPELPVDLREQEAAYQALQQRLFR